MTFHAPSTESFVVIKEDAVVRTPFYEFGSRDIFESITLKRLV